MKYEPKLFSGKLLTIAGLMLLATTASATVISVSSSGYGAGADVTGLVGLEVGPLPGGASGTAPAPYDTNDSSVSLRAGVSGLLGLNADALSGHAQSDIDSLTGDRFALGEGEVAGLALNSALISLTADVITSSARLSGDYGSIDSVGSSMLANARLNVAGQTIDLDANAAANTQILPGLLNPLGLSLILNEQTMGTNGSGQSSFMVNALHLTFDDALLGLGVLNGDITLGHSEASIVTMADAGNGGGTPEVPAPGANWLFLLAGLALVMIGLEVRKRSPVSSSTPVGMLAAS